MNDHAMSAEAPDPDTLATQIIDEARALAVQEPLLRALLKRRIGEVPHLAALLSRMLAAELEQPELAYRHLVHFFRTLYSEKPAVVEIAASDIGAVLRRDPATDSPLSVVLEQKGFQALCAHRVAHALWNNGRAALARQLHAAARRSTGVDIHPACRIGRAVMLDHGLGIVLGETAAIGDNVSIMQGVTLGGTGKEHGDRHPKVGDGVLIGAGATLLGNIRIGTHARIGAGSVVLADVPAYATAVGVPAKSRVRARGEAPAESMDHLVTGR